MRIQQLIASAGLVAVFGATASAQDTTRKPGGLNKVAHVVSKTSKTVGRTAKEVVKSGSSDAHQVLKKAGNDTKVEAKRTTGYTAKTPKPGEKPGGLNKVARDISHTSKEAGADVKHTVKKTGTVVHTAATTTGKAVKDTIKIKPPHNY